MTTPLEYVLDVVRAEPLCAETPVPVLREPITPAASVYVRSNFSTPMLGSGHEITVGGAVDAPFTIGLAELATMPQRTVTVTMECAGNWRLGMDPVPEGEPWKFGAVSTTSWSGVSLRALLERAGVQAHGCEVLATGADCGPRSDAEPSDTNGQGDVVFARALPIDVALREEVLVATQMDGVPLTIDHGAPMRLIVPGWYGMASVKWLASLDVITTPYTGYFQQKRYVYDRAGEVTPVREALVKSLITEPAPGGILEAGAPIRGWAWSGGGAIMRVEVAVGERWYDAVLGAPATPWAWTPFLLEVELPAGEVVLRSRATDATGAVQPEAIVWNRLGYGNNAVRPVSAVSKAS